MNITFTPYEDCPDFTYVDILDGGKFLSEISRWAEDLPWECALYCHEVGDKLELEGDDLPEIKSKVLEFIQKHQGREITET